MLNRFKKWDSGGKKAKDLFNKMKYVCFIKDVKKFEDTCQLIMDFIDKNSDDYNYMQQLFSKKKKYALCYLKSKFCGGINCTSRVESVNHVLSLYLSSKARLQEVILAFRKIELVQYDSFNESSFKQKKVFVKLGNNISSKNPDVLPLLEIYSPYCLTKFLNEEALLAHYTITKTNFSNTQW
jgi:hypothetical protein